MMQKKQIIVDYEHDIFISYPHQKEHLIWVNEIFLEILELYLTNDLGRPVKIFIDRKGIESGDTWPHRLKCALACSRLLVPIWSVNYFYSNWCMAECSTILYRESKLGLRTIEKPFGLIHPVRLFDGKKYPDFAMKIQACDCTDFNIIGDYFKKTEQYLNLQKKLKKWTPQVAKSVENAPPWMQDWLSKKEWIDDPINQWCINSSFQFPKEPFRPPSLVGGTI